MINTTQIGFDVRPGPSGPGRYVSSLVRALHEPEWTVRFLDAEKRTSAGPAGTSVGGAGIRSAVAQLVPGFARYWLGFRREAGRMAKAIRRIPVDLFHAQNTGAEEMPVAARMAGVPRVVGTFHVDSTVDIFRARSGFAHRAVERYSNSRLHQAIAVSEATKRDWMRRTGIPSDRVVTIHNGIDPCEFGRRQSQQQARRRLGLPEHAIILGGLGRLETAKGYEYLIEALKYLRSDFPTLVVAIAGTGRLREPLESKAVELGISDRVVFLGFQQDVNLVLDAFDVFIVPSLSETLGYALLEAMAHELPAVGTTVGGIPEVIVPHTTGFLAPPRDGAALASAVRPLLDSTDLRRRLGHHGRQRVIRHFHEADMVHKTLNVYRRMLRAEDFHE